MRCVFALAWFFFDFFPTLVLVACGSDQENCSASASVSVLRRWRAAHGSLILSGGDENMGTVQIVKVLAHPLFVQY